MNVAWIRTQDGISLVVDGKAYVINSTHANYEAITQAIKEERWEDAIKLADIGNTVRNFVADSGIVLKDGVCYYNNEEVHNVVVDKIFALMHDGFSVKPLVAFLVNLLQNPSYRSRQQLYTFLEHKGLPITEDGCFLAYKGVRTNYKDMHTGTIDNSPGATPPPMERSKINDDPTVACGFGYHAGSLEYAREFGHRVVIVKINPKDVVSVPSDCDCQKLRMCAYTVIGDWKDTQQYMPDSVYNPYCDEDDDDDDDYYCCR